MGADFIAFFVIVTAALIFFTYRKGMKQNKTSLKNELVQIISPRPVKETDAFLKDIEEERIRAENAIDSVTKEISSELDAKYGADQALKQRLSAYAREQKLDRALTDLWEQVQHYGAWSKRDDWEEWNRYNWQQIDCTNSADTNSRDRTESISFVDQGRKYKLTRVISPCFVDDGDTAEVFLEEDGQLVFGIKASYTYEEFASYSVFDITAFKKQGSWATMLIRCQNIDRVNSEKTRLQMKHYGAESIKERFKE